MTYLNLYTFKDLPLNR